MGWGAFVETREQDCGCWGSQEGALEFQEHRRSLPENEEVPDRKVVTSCTVCVNFTPQNDMLKNGEHGEFYPVGYKLAEAQEDSLHLWDGMR